MKLLMFFTAFFCLLFSHSFVQSENQTSNNDDPNRPLGRGIIEIQQALVPMETGLFAGSRDAYVKVYVDNKYVGQTTVIDDNHNPKWYERIRTGPLKKDTVIKFDLWDKDYFEADDWMGSVSINMEEVVKNNQYNTPIHKEYPGGFLQFRMAVLPCQKGKNCGS